MIKEDNSVDTNKLFYLTLHEAESLHSKEVQNGAEGQEVYRVKNKNKEEQRENI